MTLKCPQKRVKSKHLFIDYETLASRYIATLSRSSSGGALRLAQLYGAGLSAVKTDNRIATVDDYATTQQWAKAFHAHPANVDGIVYMSRYLGNRRSVVLFDRTSGAIRFNNSLPLLHHAELARLLDTYHVSLVLSAAKKAKKKKNKKRRKKRKRDAR